MPTLDNNQISILKNKGLTDEKIQALAQANGYEMPKQGFFKNVGQALIKSETKFGQSIAGALGNILPGSMTGRKAVEQANLQGEQITTQLLQKIKEKREKGEDVSRLVGALGTLQKDINFFDILNENTGGSLDKTAKQIFGEGFGVGVDIVGAGALPGTLGKVTKAKSVIEGVKTGAKAGATTGSLIGAGQGLTSAMQEDKTGKQILGQTIGSGLSGGVTGGVLGGTIGGISGGIAGKADRVAKKAEDFALDLVSPKQTADVKAQALKEGRVTEAGLLKQSKITPSRRDEQLAEAVKDVISPNESATKNIIRIDNKVKDINESVKAYVKTNKVPFNTKQLESKLNNGKDELKLVFASDTNAKKTYNAVVKEFIKHVESKDTAGLLDARQSFDKIPAIKKLLESQGLGENTKGEVALTVRRMANEYVTDLLPKGNEYRALLQKESKMIEAIGNIAEKNEKLVGQNNIQILIKKYPILKYALAGYVGSKLLPNTSNFGNSPE